MSEGITYKVKNFIDADEMKRDMAFSPDPVGLSNAMVGQAALLARYGVILADASHQVDTVKMLLENVESVIYKTVREKKMKEGEKFTEPLLQSLVATHPRVVSAKKAVSEAKRVEAICKIAVEGFRHRRDMLIQQGSTSREEMKGELRINEASVRDSVLEAQKQSVLARRQSVK